MPSRGGLGRAWESVAMKTPERHPPDLDGSPRAGLAIERHPSFTGYLCPGPTFGAMGSRLESGIAETPMTLTQMLTRHRTFPPVLSSLAYLGIAVVVLWMGFRSPVTEPPLELEELQAGTDSSLKAAQATLELVEANNTLTKLILSGTAGGDSNSLRTLEQSLQTNLLGLEKLAAERRQREDAMNHRAAERANAQLSRLKRQRWSAGIAGFFLLLLAWQASFGWGRSRPLDTTAR